MICNNLREFRLAASLTETELAKRVNCHKSTISKIERHLSLPSAEMMVKIADVLGKPVGRIFFQPEDVLIQRVGGGENRG